MGTAKDQRAAATRERRRKEQRIRAEARAVEQRAVRKASANANDPTPLQAPWPVVCRWEASEAWVSEEAESTPHHHVGLVRMEGDRRAAVFWRADARTGAIDDIVRLAGVTEDRVNAEVVRRAQQRPLLSAEPADAAAAWIDAALLRPTAPPDPALEAIVLFLRGLDADQAITPLSWGVPAEVSPPKPTRASWWQRLWRP
jgi:hypothetical protein